MTLKEANSKLLNFSVGVIVNLKPAVPHFTVQYRWGNFTLCNGYCKRVSHWNVIGYVFCNSSILVTLYKIGKVYFSSHGTNGFHVLRQRIRDLLLWAHAVVRTPKMNILHHQLLLADYVKNLYPASHWFVVVLLLLPSLSSCLKLPTDLLVQSFSQINHPAFLSVLPITN